MFIKESVFKRLIKAAFVLSDLIVGYDEERDQYMICANKWCILVNDDALTNKSRASLIELIGEMPRGPFLLKAGKDDIQYQLADTTGWEELSDLWTSATYEYILTAVSIHRPMQSYRILQSKSSKALILLNEEYLSLVEKHAIKTDYLVDDSKEPEIISRLEVLDLEGK